MAAVEGKASPRTNFLASRARRKSNAGLGGSPATDPVTAGGPANDGDGDDDEEGDAIVGEAWVNPNSAPSTERNGKPDESQRRLSLADVAYSERVAQNDLKSEMMGTCVRAIRLSTVETTSMQCRRGRSSPYRTHTFAVGLYMRYSTMLLG